MLNRLSTFFSRSKSFKGAFIATCLVLLTIFRDQQVNAVDFLVSLFAPNLFSFLNFFTLGIGVHWFLYATGNAALYMVFFSKVHHIKVILIITASIVILLTAAGATGVLLDYQNLRSFSFKTFDKVICTPLFMITAYPLKKLLEMDKKEME
jgi:hypothetical protein